jgi:hypothetical protein
MRCKGNLASARLGLGGGVLALSLGVGLALVACFDDTVRARPDGGVTPTADGSTPTAIGPVPEGSIVGGTKNVAGTLITTWTKTDPTTKAVTSLGWALPLNLISTVASTVDFREPIAMPAEVTTQTGIHGVTIDYLPRGHAPPGVYDTPHWEFHLFYMPEADFVAINCQDPTTPPKETLPENFAVVPPPDNCTPGMGLHGIDVLSPEFNQARFTKSHTLSFYAGQLTALEPKMTREILLERKSFSFAVPRMKNVLSGKLYPNNFEAVYDPALDAFQITYSNFTPMP